MVLESNAVNKKWKEHYKKIDDQHGNKCKKIQNNLKKQAHKHNQWLEQYYDNYQDVMRQYQRRFEELEGFVHNDDDDQMRENPGVMRQSQGAMGQNPGVCNANGPSMSPTQKGVPPIFPYEPEGGQNL